MVMKKILTLILVTMSMLLYGQQEPKGLATITSISPYCSGWECEMIVDHYGISYCKNIDCDSAYLFCDIGDQVWLDSTFTAVYSNERALLWSKGIYTDNIQDKRIYPLIMSFKDMGIINHKDLVRYKIYEQ